MENLHSYAGGDTSQRCDLSTDQAHRTNHQSPITNHVACCVVGARKPNNHTRVHACIWSRMWLCGFTICFTICKIFSSVNTPLVRTWTGMLCISRYVHDMFHVCLFVGLATGLKVEISVHSFCLFESKTQKIPLGHGEIWARTNHVLKLLCSTKLRI